MPRKKSVTAEASTDATATTQQAETSTATLEAPVTRQAEPVPTEPTVVSEEPKNWGPPYKAVFTSPEKGFELGENRRFKQRVFTFKEKPDEQVIAKLKDHGFVYRPAEKAWTISADAATRLITDRLAAEFAGTEAAMSR